MGRMDLAMLFSILAFCSSLAYAQPAGPPSRILPPAPAPAPEYVNLTQLLSVAGPFSIFLSRLESTKVIDTLQNQANSSSGVTMFVPKDSSFQALNSALSKLSDDQVKQLLLCHALPKFYSLSDFKNLSEHGPASTLAGGGSYALNLTYISGTVHVKTELVETNVTSSVHSTPLVSVFEVGAVLLQKAIIGDKVPLAPLAAPAPSPTKSKSPAAADTPSSSNPGGSGSAPGAAPSTPSSSHRSSSWGIWSQLALAVAGGVVSFL